MAYGMFRLGERVEDRRLMFPRRSDRLALPWLPLPRARPAAPSAKVSERTSRGHRTPRAASSGVPCSHRCRPPHVIFPRPARRAAGQLARQPLNGGPTSMLISAVCSGSGAARHPLWGRSMSITAHPRWLFWGPPWSRRPRRRGTVARDPILGRAGWLQPARAWRPCHRCAWWRQESARPRLYKTGAATGCLQEFS